MNQRILCCIFDYNDHAHASAWADRLSPYFDTLILDSGSNPRCGHPLAVPLDNLYYSGLMNESYARAKQGDYGWVAVITSDVQISDGDVPRLAEAMRYVATTYNVGLYQPSTAWRGRSLPQSRCHFTGGMRSANFQEGWFHLVRIDLMGKVCPIDVSLNRLGWGVDLALSHFARLEKLLVLVDDRIRVVHPGGSGYGREEAERQMRAWHASIPGYTSPRHFRPLRVPVRTEQLIVSLTSWKPRLGNLPAVLDTIFGQTVPPDLVVLNLARGEELPPVLDAYIASHKIQVNRVEDTKVYKKLIPTLRLYPEACVVSIDDDWLYPAGMLEDFVKTHLKHPGQPVSGNRVRLFHLYFHCGCASLTKREFFGDSLDMIDAQVMENCESDDAVYTFFLHKNGRLYVHTKGLYFENMTPYNSVEPYSPAKAQAPERTWAYLRAKFE